MIQPERAVVTPRVIWPETGDAVPIDEIFHRMESTPVGAIEIVGCFGSGKTTALRHLAAEAPNDREIVWADDAKPEEVTSRMRECWVVYTSTAHLSPITGSSFQLAGWGDDDRIEYLLATHSDKCQSVIARLAQADRSDIGDTPMLWRIVLDEMAEDESIRSIDDAFWKRLTCALPRRPRHLAEEYCVAVLTANFDRATQAFQEFEKHSDENGLRLLSAPGFAILLASDYLARWLNSSRGGDPLLPVRSSVPARVLRSLFRSAESSETSPLALPPKLVVKTAELVAESPRALERLREILAEDDPHLQPMAASILHAADTEWTPRLGLCLDRAYLPRAAWPGIDLNGTNMARADLSGSDLAHARLDRAHANDASFRNAALPEASLVELVAPGASFAGADLTGANLQGAGLQFANLPRTQLRKANVERANLQYTDLRRTSFVEADLRRAKLSGAKIADTDFTSANLDGADLHSLDLRDAIFHNTCLAHADLGLCNLEEMRLVGVDFTGATLMLALLSGSVMVGAILREASLKSAGLADIQWEGADLRFANFQGAVFHLGTTRSGLVDSPLASEATRTGFYTDEFDEQSYQAPEQIRKANLCGADLRGARVNSVDFYLVDLRGSKYDANQLEHFRRCGAILA